MRSHSALVSSLVLPLCAALPTAAQAGCVPANSAIDLSGQLRTERRAGPPNYGESPEDLVRTIYILRLPVPIDLCGRIEDGVEYRPIRNVSEVQVHPLGRTSPRPGAWRGRGRLSEAQIGSDYLDVIFLTGL